MVVAVEEAAEEAAEKVVEVEVEAAPAEAANACN